MRPAVVLVIATAAMMAVPASVSAQNRAALIERARAEFSDDAAIQLLLAAQDPGLGEPDSLWTVAAYDLAAALIRNGQHEHARTWLRLAVRHGAHWPMGRTAYPSAVLDGYDEAVRTVRTQPDPGSTAVRTAWDWAGRLDSRTPGRLSVNVQGGSASVGVAVTGRSEPMVDGVVTLPAGTYELVLTAEGHETVRVTREVLPGIGTSIELELVPVLSAEALARARSHLVQIVLTRGGQPVCGSGVIASADGLVLTSSDLVRDARTVDVLAADGRAYRNIPIAQADPERGLAVLRISPPTAAPTVAAGLDDRSYAWSAHHASCGSAGVSRTRVASWDRAQHLPIALLEPLPDAARGAPLVDRAGLLVGIASDATTAVPFAAAQVLLERVRTPVAIAEARPARRKFPWLWLSAGGAAAGLAGLLLAGGGSGSPGGQPAPPPPPSTGGIIITFPN